VSACCTLNVMRVVKGKVVGNTVVLEQVLPEGATSTWSCEALATVTRTAGTSQRLGGRRLMLRTLKPTQAS
jgi:hypothetical protein